MRRLSWFMPTFRPFAIQTPRRNFNVRKKTIFALAVTSILTASALAENSLDGLDPYYNRDGQFKSPEAIIPQAINGTRPTILSGLSVVATSSTKMRVSGRLTSFSGMGLAGKRVNIYSVGEAYLTRLYTTYTDTNGSFSVETNKVPIGNKIQIDVPLSGAYNEPLPTFNRP